MEKFCCKYLILTAQQRSLCKQKEFSISKDTNIFNTIEIAIVLVPLVVVHADEAADVS